MAPINRSYKKVNFNHPPRYKHNFPIYDIITNATEIYTCSNCQNRYSKYPGHIVVIDDERTPLKYQRHWMKNSNFHIFEDKDGFYGPIATKHLGFKERELFTN